MTTEKIYLMVWKADSSMPGFIEPLRYKESELPDHNRSEVLGPFREFLEIPAGSNLEKLWINAGDIRQGDPLWDVLRDACTWNWETNELNLVYRPEPNWDDVRMQRNMMLQASDNMFNEDTPDPLKSEWIEYRALLRDLVNREQAAGRTPSTVFWNDYVPPYPPSARNGVPDEIKPLCVWYVEGKYTSAPPPPNQGE